MNRFPEDVVGVELSELKVYRDPFIYVAIALALAIFALTVYIAIKVS